MNNNNIAIKVDNVKKYFKVFPDKRKTLKDRILFQKRNRYEIREILKGISFEVGRGEAVGLIGKNGCGKSTTLKLLTRILRPNEGTITINGRVSSLIELGAGFHPDLTGRENIYINASIFGIKAKEVDKRLDDIIRFSELEEYIDNPVRTYSSGMYMRLAFAVAINVDADVLLIDEILAVGDINFQEKCFHKLQEIKRKGTTIVIVSHSQSQIEQICDRCIWIEDGLIRNDGSTKMIFKEYQRAMDDKRAERARLEAEAELGRTNNDASEDAAKKAEEIKRLKNLTCREICRQCGSNARREGTENAEFVEVSIKSNKDRLLFGIGDEIPLELKCVSGNECNNFKITLNITRSDGVFCFGTSVRCNIDGEQTFFLRLENSLLEGRYYIDMIIKDEQGNTCDALYQIIEFEVETADDTEVGIVHLEHQWCLE